MHAKIKILSGLRGTISHGKDFFAVFVSLEFVIVYFVLKYCFNTKS